ncbi:MAG: hypothetical protein ACRBCS_10960 [Cellvibrionaceae bacterium]
MVNHCIRKGLLIAGVITASLVAATSTFADNHKPTRTADGNPDFNGVWQTTGRANYNIEPHSASAAMAMREGPFVPVPAKAVVALGAVGSVPASLGIVEGDKIPYKPEALKQRDANKANWLKADPEVKCYLPGIPRATYMPYQFQIFQNKDALFFAYEYAGAVRNVLLEDPGPAPIDSWMGQSWAKWEKDTLVITTTDQNGETWLDRAGNYIGYGATVVERFTQTGPNTASYEATIENPDVFTKPWTISTTLYKMAGKDAQLQQFKCVEFVEELMYGHLRKVPLD